VEVMVDHQDAVARDDRDQRDEPDPVGDRQVDALQPRAGPLPPGGPVERDRTGPVRQQQGDDRADGRLGDVGHHLHGRPPRFEALAQQQEVRVIGFDEFMREVLENNFDLILERFEVSAAEAAVRTARLFEDPELEVLLPNFDRRDFDDVPRNLAFEMDIPIETAGKRRNRIRLANAERMLAEANRVFDEIAMYQAILKVAERYGCDLEINRSKKFLGDVEGQLQQVIEWAIDLGFDPDTLQTGVDVITEIQGHAPCIQRMASCGGKGPSAPQPVGKPAATVYTAWRRSREDGNGGGR
jgi:hypothetical protein